MQKSQSLASTSNLTFISSVNDIFVSDSQENLKQREGIGEMLNGEQFQLEIKGITLFNKFGKIELEDGSMVVTCFRIIFIFPEKNMTTAYKTLVTFASILKLDKENSNTHEIYNFTTKDLNYLSIGIPVAERKRKDLQKTMSKFLFPKSKKKLFCYQYGETFPINGWTLFKLDAEFSRFAAPNWKVFNLNGKYDLSPAYPASFILPQMFSEEEIYGLFTFRYEGKIPILVWANGNKYLLRCGSAISQTDDLSGLSNTFRSPEEEKLLKKIMELSNKNTLTLYESTKESEHLYSKFYFEKCKIVITGIPSDNQFIDALREIISMCTDFPEQDLDNPGKQKKAKDDLYNSKWIELVSKMIYQSFTISRKIDEAGEAAILVSSPTHNASCITSALVQLILDPYYRSVLGFITLIEKEFIYYGHKFGSFKKKDDDQFSALFLCFLDCVWQITMQFPFSFEFEETLLLFLIDSVYSCQFGTFLCSSEKERNACKISSTPSVWGFILGDLSMFKNPLYSPNNAPLSVMPIKEIFRVWNTFYFRHRFKFTLLRVGKNFASIRQKGYTTGDFSQSDLPFLPAQPWKSFANLTELVLSVNHLVKFPLEVTFLTSLKRLLLDKNDISFISADILSYCVQNLTSLEELNLSNNLIYQIPASIANFPSLKILSLANNLLRRLPNFSNCVGLHTLDVGNNPLESIIFDNLVNPTLTSLSICSLGIDEIPNSFFQMKSLTAVNISGNKLKSIPERLGTLDLKYLNISCLSVPVPPTVFQFTNLLELNLSKMNLSSLPDEIANLVNLSWLGLSYNKFTQFPSVILNCSNLQTLFLDHNELENLPLDISMLSQLIEFHLEYNSLTSLSPGIGNITRLIYLNVSNNQIRHLPATIGYLHFLKGSKNFFFENNLKLLTPPPEIIRAGFDKVFTYLQSLLEGSRKCYRMKIMVVGQENVGKSSLLRCLIAHNHNVKKRLKQSNKIHADKTLAPTGLDSMSTDGIDIGKMSFYCKFLEPGVPIEQVEKTKVELSLWDFAGQEIYYSTHQFFLSERAVYLLVWNLSKNEEDSRVEYWLKSIYARAKNAPIIIVATHLDHAKCTKEYVVETLTALQNKYLKNFPSIKQIIPVSCSNNINIEEVNLWVQEIVRNQPHMGEMIPTSYLELEKLATVEGAVRIPPVVNWEQFRAMGNICNIKSDPELITATSLLNDFGSLVYFQKEKGLEDVVILDPQWLTDVMSTIITTKHSYTRSGVLDHQNLQMIWRAPHFPPNLHKVLLNLLEKFEISYYMKSTQIDGDIYSGKSLVPALLPEERHSSIDQKWPRFPSISEPQYSRTYRFKFIPHGFISRLLVRVLHFAEASIIWRHGMLVEAEDHQFGYYSILIDAQPARKEISITIRGSSGAKLSQLIIETLNALIEGWNGLEPEVCIPCIHCIRQKMYDPYIFLMEECELAAIQGKSTVKCRDVKPIRLDELAPDVAMTHVQNCKLDYSELELGTLIGEGGFAWVYKGNYKSYVVAIKKIKFEENHLDLNDISEVQAFAEFRREVWIMSGLSHHNIIQMIGFTMDPFCIVTEFIPCGNLYDLVHDASKPLDESFQWRSIIDIAKGMNFLHTTSPPIIHRDLKSPNVLIVTFDVSSQVIAKVGDFGLSQALASTTKGRSVSNPIWLAPEIMMNEEYSEKADVYSFAVIVWEVFTRKEFFGECDFLSKIENLIISGNRPNIPSDVPPEINDLIQKCWAAQPDARPSFTVILEMLKSAFTKYYSHLADIAFAEPEENKVIRPIAPAALPQKRSKDEIEQEEREFELSKRQQSKKEVEKVTKRVGDFSSGIMCLEVVGSTIWVGTKEGAAVIYDFNFQKIATLSIAATPILSMVYTNDTVWCSFPDGIRCCTSRAPYKVKKEIKGQTVFTVCAFGKYVWAGSEQAVTYYNIKNAKLKKKVKVEGVCCLSLFFDDSNQVLWVGTDNSTKPIIRFNSKMKMIDFKIGHTGNVTALREVQGYVWSSSTDKTIRIWNMNDASCLKILSGHQGPIYSLINVNQHVWSCSWDKTVILWDAMYQMYFKDYEAHSDTVSSLLYLPQISQVLTGSNDKSMVCWDLKKMNL